MLKLSKVLNSMEYKKTSKLNPSDEKSNKKQIDEKSTNNSRPKDSKPTIPMEDSYPLF